MKPIPSYKFRAAEFSTSVSNMISSQCSLCILSMAISTSFFAMPCPRYVDSTASIPIYPLSLTFLCGSILHTMQPMGMLGVPLLLSTAMYVNSGHWFKKYLYTYIEYGSDRSASISFLILANCSSLRMSNGLYTISMS
ncbi:hypothetical protein WN66_06601 [Saccharomyces cerevisiae]|uniref:Putative uncharacterized membrane protein YPR050C n=2 Tax=Saccharomyces cerevisiae TaxID=4932 RepID=YP050_YEAST|nr:RecName: Full=Putative uncharacterized membrane protein YPR050C [Saccharomyces cerevisiae S288C]AHX39342.1 hypothetical protein YPR050C [Saccharomyces cerevisiae]KZV07566.1 hypothetical protein WN66_06601 [Saccharomyces cerevisiae]CAY87006.1 EC1118_1P2_3697p [Saccharomyces cerevisiae EC1118]